MVTRNAADGRLTFTTDLPAGVRQSDVVFIAVGTPSKESGETDLSHVEGVAAEIGRTASERTLSRLGAKKAESSVLPMVLENRAAGRLVGALTAALSGQALQQKRSFLEGKVGQPVASPLLTLTDDPLVPKGFGSRLFDGEGIAAKVMPVFEKGVLRNYYVDTYYGKKLQMAPTTGGSSNLELTLGDRGQAGLLADIKDGILVTGFLGGNSNATTGDFSLAAGWKLNCDEEGFGYLRRHFGGDGPGLAREVASGVTCRLVA
jgi:PmbA protein